MAMEETRNSNSLQVLIAGAGPTGLALALSLAHRGIAFRLIDENDRPGEHSRAMVVHARTLEFYNQFGFADEVVEQGIKVGTVHLREGGRGKEAREVLSVCLNDVGEGISPYPFALAYPQDDHERLLVKKLAAMGIQVEWGTKLTGCTQDSHGVRATVQDIHGCSLETQVEFLCGCDGAHSRVREVLRLNFPGGSYDQLFFVADVKINAGFERDLFVNLGEHILALLLPVRSSGMQRLIGLVPRELSSKRELSFEDIRDHVEPLVNVRVTEVNWFSTYHVHHRVAEHFQSGRAFLLGDAGHIHSPAGGQGMNTGIGDAINLGWKLAQVLRGRAKPSLLETYERERIDFARKLVATTDRAFTALVAEGVRGELTRRVLAPVFLTVATRFASGRRAFFRTLSQTQIHYANSPLSTRTAGHVHGGDRLPWAGKGGVDNFAPLRSLDWQLHVYGETDPTLVTMADRLAVPLHVFACSDDARHAGLKRGAAYLVRPDGYVAVAAEGPSASSTIEEFVRRLDLHFA
jgi:2-polyprenyl-6-methoxyphenol hydroxylase-like FAD-dependent oxidoreductase